MDRAQNDGGRTDGRTRLAAAIAAVAVVAVGLIVWLVSRGDDDSDSASTEVPTTTTAPSLTTVAGSDASLPATSGSSDPTVTSPATAATTSTTGDSGAVTTLAAGPETTSPATVGPIATAPVTPASTAPPVEVSLDEGADLGAVDVEITQIESVEGEARGVGERSGPSLRITLALTNSTSEPVATDLALVNLYYGEELTPATELSGPGVEMFPSTAGAGETVTGRLVFLVPEDERDHVVIEFTYSTEAPKALFSGAVV
jgi:cytoskeletal protein RodZ